MLQKPSKQSEDILKVATNPAKLSIGGALALVAVVNARDYEAVRARLTDDWTYFTSAGRKRNFDEWKELVQRYTELRIEFTDVRAEVSEDGRLAWSTFCGRIRGEVDGKIDDREVLFTAIIEKVDDEWKLRHLQGTESSQSC